MSIFNKLNKDINEADLQELIFLKVAERHNLEYKLEQHGNDDESIREMLRDISSLANANGGHLLIGVEVDKDGLPISIKGIDNAETERERIISSYLSNIEPHISGLEVSIIPLSNKKSVISLWIPKSLKAPHMINFRGLNQFWIRHDRQKAKMSIDEIKESFLRAEGVVESIRSFMSKRKIEIIEGTQGKPTYFISATPLSVNNDLFDIHNAEIRKILRDPPNQISGYQLESGNNNFPIPTLNGLKIEVNRLRSVELHRNAHLECILCKPYVTSEIHLRDQSKQLLLSVRAIVAYPVNFLNLYYSLLSEIGIEEPFLFQISLLNIGSCFLSEQPLDTTFDDAFSPALDNLKPWNQKHLELPPIQVNYAENPHAIAKTLLDKLWQAFGFEWAPLYKVDKFLL